MKCILAILFIILQFLAYAVDSDGKKDSLTEVYTSSNIDTVKILTGFEIIKAFEYNIDSAEAYFNEIGLLVARSGSAEYQIQFQIIKGKCLTQSGDVPASITQFEKAMESLKKIDNPALTFEAYNELVYAYLSLGDSKTALDYAYKEEKLILNAKGDYPAELVSLYTSIGTIFKRENNFEYALDYFNKSLAICDSLGLMNQRSVVLNNLGGLYQTNGDFETAKEFHFESLEWNLKIGNRAAIAKSYGNLSLIFSEEENLEQAVEYMLKASRLFDEINDWQGALLAHQFLGNIYMGADSLKKAEAQLEAARNMCIEREQQYIYVDVLASLSELYEKQGRHKEALELIREEKVLRDSIENERLDEELVNLKLQYDNDRKLLQDSLNQVKEKEQDLLRLKEEEKAAGSQKIIFMLAGAIAFLLVIISVVLYRGRKKSGG